MRTSGSRPNCPKCGRMMLNIGMDPTDTTVHTTYPPKWTEVALCYIDKVRTAFLVEAHVIKENIRPFWEEWEEIDVPNQENQAEAPEERKVLRA